MAGVVMLLWLVSGVFMVLPAEDETVATPGVASPPLGEVVLSPAEAIRRAGAPPGSDLVIKRLGADHVYQVFTEPGKSRLVNGRTGAVMTVTVGMAESLAFGPAGVKGRQARRIEKHGGPYIDGPLPVYQFDAGPPGAYLFVQVADGRVVRSTRATRARRSIVEWHSFEPLRRLVGDRPNHWALLAASALGIAMVVTGYLILLPRRRGPG